MNKILNLFIYYFSLLFGLGIISWMIWSRFIRERTIRDIPDTLLTEYRFWILLYICFIYLYVIKNLIKPKEANPFITDIANIIYKPLITFDHFIKYNKYIKVYYYKSMVNFIKHLDFEKLDNKKITIIIFFMQVFPRIILVTFLLLDTFYFKRLEIFYQVVLIGVLPFLYRYIKYSIKDVNEQWIKEIEDRYKNVILFVKKDCDNDDENSKKIINAPYHHEYKTIKEYLDIKLENMFDFARDKVEYEYNAFPVGKDTYIQQYLYEKYKSNKENYKESIYTKEFLKTYGGYLYVFSEERLQKDFEKFIAKKYIFDHYKPFIIAEKNPNAFSKITFEDYSLINSEDSTNIKKLYYEFSPSLIILKLFFLRLEYISEYKIIRWSKIVIFSLYLLCWFYILIISYMNSPLELIMGKYFVINLFRYLLKENEPFSDMRNYSINKNMVTIKNIKDIWKKIKEKL